VAMAERRTPPVEEFSGLLAGGLPIVDTAGCRRRSSPSRRRAPRDRAQKLATDEASDAWEWNSESTADSSTEAQEWSSESATDSSTEATAAEEMGQMKDLSRARAVALQEELLVMYRSSLFQDKLKRLRKMEDEEEQFAAFKQLVRGVQNEVLPKYGFEAGGEGAKEMKASFAAFEDDRVVSSLSALIVKAMTGNGTLRRHEAHRTLDATKDNLLNLAPLPSKRVRWIEKLSSFTDTPSILRQSFLDKALHEGAAQVWPQQPAPEKDAPDKEASPQEASVSGEAEDGVRLPELTKARAEALLQELQGAFSSRRTQKRVALLDDGSQPPLELRYAVRGGLDAQFAPGVWELAVALCEEVLPNYGFAGTASGFRQFWRAIRPHAEEDPALRDKATAVLRRLQAPEEARQRRAREDQRVCTPFVEDELKRARALNLQLIAHYNLPRFQSQLNGIHRSFSPSSASFGQRLGELLRGAYEEVLPRFGFAVDEDGLLDYTLAMSRLLRDPDMQVLAGAIDDTLYGAEQEAQADSSTWHGGDRRLGRRDVLLLLREQLAAFSEPAFQCRVKRLREAMRTSPKDDFSELAGRKDLAMSVQRSILPKYGLHPDHRGSYSMFLQCAHFVFDPEVARLITGINCLLGMERVAAKAFVKRLQSLRGESRRLAGA